MIRFENLSRDPMTLFFSVNYVPVSPTEKEENETAVGRFFSDDQEDNESLDLSTGFPGPETPLATPLNLIFDVIARAWEQPQEDIGCGLFNTVSSMESYMGLRDTPGASQFLDDDGIDANTRRNRGLVVIHRTERGASDMANGVSIASRLAGNLKKPLRLLVHFGFFPAPSKFCHTQVTAFASEVAGTTHGAGGPVISSAPSEAKPSGEPPAPPVTTVPPKGASDTGKADVGQDAGYVPPEATPRPKMDKFTPPEKGAEAQKTPDVKDGGDKALQDLQDLLNRQQAPQVKTTVPPETATPPSGEQTDPLGTPPPVDKSPAIDWGSLEPSGAPPLPEEKLPDKEPELRKPPKDNDTSKLSKDGDAPKKDNDTSKPSKDGDAPKTTAGLSPEELKSFSSDQLAILRRILGSKTSNT